MDDENQEQEKPFDTVLIVLLMMVAVSSDAADLATLAGAAIPVVGQVLYFGNGFLISPIVWAILQGTFVMKTGGFKSSSLVVMGGGLGNIIGLPGSETVTTIIAIVMANNPKLKEVADMASGKGIGGVGGAKEVEIKMGDGKSYKSGMARAGTKEAAEIQAKNEAASAESLQKLKGGRPSEPGGAAEETVGRRPSEVGRPSETPSTSRDASPQQSSGQAGQAGAAEGVPGGKEGEPQKPKVSERELGLKEAPGEVYEMEELKKLTEEPLPEIKNEGEEREKKQKNVVPFRGKAQPPAAKGEDENLKKAA